MQYIAYNVYAFLWPLLLIAAYKGRVSIMQWTYWTILATCWGLFCLVWVAGWIYNFLKAPPVARRSSFQAAWIIGLAAIITVTVLYALIPPQFWAFITFVPPWLRVLGAACLIISTAFSIWARLTLGTMWSFLDDIKVGHQLRTEGPYRFTRHPMYTGTLGMLLGSVLMSGLSNWMVYFLVWLIVDIVKIPSEERLLKETFGEQYIQYQQQVPQLIPGLHLLKRYHLRDRRGCLLHK
jgi:protein-S-isoprenylcysteine O-methyltransferase Ste14